jgi:hypothetical protein
MLVGADGVTGTALDLSFRVFCTRNTGDNSAVPAGCARASIGPSTPSGLARTASEAMPAKERTFRFSSGWRALGRVRHTEIPCINRPLVTAFLRPEDWSKDLSIATFVKSFLSRTSPCSGRFWVRTPSWRWSSPYDEQPQRRFRNVRTGSNSAIQRGLMKVSLGATSRSSALPTCL